jgi:hypothetical protein
MGLSFQESTRQERWPEQPCRPRHIFSDLRIPSVRLVMKYPGAIAFTVIMYFPVHSMAKTFVI